ncbi:HNH endonuclease [Bacillus toyonensis]|uniref:HNH endonuclease n=1 Tax=Bacillus toyonensis TaxID=155322 RepID=UPI000BF37F87|nr:HNH endonuclease [Bacillus toyonensis]PEP78615.1 HNH endonuclease [Bacillus toyonensis]
MIRLKKEKIPDVLEVNGGEWTRQYMEYFNSGEKIPNSLKSKYAHPSIKEALLKETKGKCAYCESSFIATDYGDIEHIEPKSKVPSKIFEWNNLTIACGKCNLSKRDYLNAKLPLLNPYIDEPEKEIRFIGPIIFAGSKRGKMTIKKLQLDRIELYERRRAYINSIQPLIDFYFSADEHELKKLLYEQLLEYTEENKEYVSMIKSIIKTIDSPVPVEV